MTPRKKTKPRGLDEELDELLVDIDMLGDALADKYVEIEQVSQAIVKQVLERAYRRQEQCVIEDEQ